MKLVARYEIGNYIIDIFEDTKTHKFCVSVFSENGVKGLNDLSGKEAQGIMKLLDLLEQSKIISKVQGAWGE